MMTISGFTAGAWSTVDGSARLTRFLDGQPVARNLVERFGRFDLDAEAGEPDIGARPGGVQLDRADPQIAQDLRAEPDLAPFPAAFELGGGGVFGDRGGRHPGGAVAQINEDAAARLLETAEGGVDRLGPAEHILDDIGAMQP